MTEVIFLSQTWQFIPVLGVSGWVKAEIVKDHTYVDSQANREMIWNRFSYARTVHDSVTGSISGAFDILYEVPFGLGTVSGA